MKQIVVLIAVASMLAQDLPAPKSSPPKIPQPDLPMPRLPRLPLPGGKPKPRKTEPPEVQQYAGVVRKSAPDSLEIERLDSQAAMFACDDNTRFVDGDDVVTWQELKAGDEVLVHAKKSGDKLLALKVEIRREKEISKKDEDEDPDRPKLKRVERVAQPTSEEQQFWTRAINEAREYNSKFLPNFTCREFVARFYSTARKPSFRLHDKLSVDVAYIGGKEYYTNHRIGNRHASKAEAEATGTWWWGEYGTTLQEVLREEANYKFVKRSQSAGLDALLYQIEVAQRDSHWRVEYKGRAVYPGYKGSVWVNIDSGRVLRIEMESTSMPADFEIEKTEWAVDYSYVPLGDDYYLLPVAAANLACWRYRYDCSLNQTEFKDYKQFTSDSFLYSSESTVDFEKPKKRK